MRILIVEDEEKMDKALRTGLEPDEFSVTVAHTGEDGFFRASTEAYDLVILDLMLPRRDGMEVLTALRQRSISIPVLILTSKDTVKDRVGGLRTSGSQNLAVFEAHAFVRQAIQSLSKEDAPKSARCEDGSVTNG